MERNPMEMAVSTDLVVDNVVGQLEVKDLLACRQVSKFWNKAASSVLRKRSTMIKKISEENQLMELQDCVEQSWDFPFAGLILDQPWRLSSGPAMKFFKNYGAIFTSLKLDTTFLKKLRAQDQAPFIHYFPRLSILQTCSPANWGSPPRVELLESAAGQEDGRILNLQSLRTFRISLNTHENFILQVLSATTPALRIECLFATYELLKTLKSAGKLEDVSVINVHEDEEDEVHALSVTQWLSTETPTLTKLQFGAGGCISQEGLMKLLISSQYTLQELRLYGIFPSQFSSECPVLAKLTTLSLIIDDDHIYDYVFQGRQGHKFPALKDLKLENLQHRPSFGSLSDGLFIVPSVTMLDLHGRFDKVGIEHLAESFPNIIEIRLNDPYSNCGWSWNGEQVDIWSVGAFKFLEKLTIWHYTVKTPTKNCMNMDSFLTGMPIEVCENLRQHAQQNLVDSPFNEITRNSPNILQLKNLKKLVVCVKLDGGLEELPQEPPFMSMVSVRYALEMMPNLEAKFVYDYNSPSWGDKRDKAVSVLKAAFKHAEPYVKLELCACVAGLGTKHNA